MMKSLFDELDDLFSVFDSEGLSRQSDVKYSVPAFPPCNVILQEDGSMKFEFALAGYKKEDLKMEYNNSKLVLSTVKDYKEEVKDKYLAKGIKKPSFNYSYFVPETKFLINELKASFNNGLLVITIPAKKEEKNKVMFVID